MNTFLKIAIGFVLGVLCFYLVQKIEEEKAKEDIKEDVQVSFLQQLKQQLESDETEEKSNKNIHFFDLTTKKGVVRLHTYMSKDSVQILMGYPQSTDVDVWDFNDEVHETWEYKVKSGYGYEQTIFTIKFVNGELVSVNQY
ncbi:MAG: hypothetical protein IKU78_03265 [Paludibacteraceae bacterium]|nr:hypothetical protein [Paludibacteraceae bacterium]